MKKKIRIGSIWAKIREKENTTDVLYGFTDGTNIHGHLVVSRINLVNSIYQRNISGATIIVSGANLYLNNTLLI